MNWLAWALNLFEHNWHDSFFKLCRAGAFDVHSCMVVFSYNDTMESIHIDPIKSRAWTDLTYVFQRCCLELLHDNAGIWCSIQLEYDKSFIWYTSWQWARWKWCKEIKKCTRNLRDVDSSFVIQLKIDWSDPTIQIKFSESMLSTHM